MNYEKEYIFTAVKTALQLLDFHYTSYFVRPVNLCLFFFNHHVVIKGKINT